MMNESARGPDESEVETWVAAALAGDAEAVTRLYRAHVKALYNFVYWRLERRVGETEEIVQETFLDAFRSLDRLQDRSAFHPWICGIARRKSAKARRRRRPPEEDLAAWDGSVEAPPGESLETGEVREAVSEALASLSPRQQHLLREAYVEDRPAAELAAADGTTAVAIHSALQRARAAFVQAVRATFRERGFPLPEPRRTRERP